MKAATVIIGGLFFLAGCREEAGSSNEAVEIWGGGLDALPEAYGAPDLDRTDRGLLEVLLIGQSWKSYDRGRFHASSPDRESLLESLDVLRGRCLAEGLEPVLVVSASGETSFREIREVIRTAAIAGICEVEFLVDQGSARVSSLPLSLPVGVACGAPTEIEPATVVVNADESVSIGLGPAKLPLDADRSDRLLPGLDARLSSFRRAAEATGSVSSIQIYVAPSSFYQRMIDVLACGEWNGIEEVDFIDVVDRPGIACGGLRLSGPKSLPPSKPRAPSRAVLSRHSGLTPLERRLPEPPFALDSD